MRRDAGAIWPSFDLVEWVAGAALPSALYLSASYQALLTAAADVVCWTNDIMTLDKELAHDDRQNLVCVLKQDRDCSLQQAIDEVVDLTDTRISDFLAIERTLPSLLERLALPPGERRVVGACVAMLRAWMRGHVEWGVEADRYRCDSRIWGGAIGAAPFGRALS